jgi:hypothetical protein
MKMRMQTFGEIEVEDERYDYDLVIEQGRIRKRRKKPSKAYRERYGHTPLSAEEAIPWHGKRLFIGTGMYGKLPVMPEVYAAAKKERVEVVALPTPELSGKLMKLKPKDVNAVLHVTC